MQDSDTFRGAQNNDGNHEEYAKPETPSGQYDGERHSLGQQSSFSKQSCNFSKQDFSKQDSCTPVFQKPVFQQISVVEKLGQTCLVEGEFENGKLSQVALIAKDVWAKSLASMQLGLEPHIYSAFLKPLLFDSFDESSSSLTISAPSKLVCNHVESNYKKVLEGRLHNEAGIKITIRLRVSDAEPAPSLQGFEKQGFEKQAEDMQVYSKHTPSSLDHSHFQKQPSKLAASTKTPNYLVVKKTKQPLKRPEDLRACVANNLNKKYSFANFVVGSSNQFCHAACMHVADDPGGAYNPLFIYGGVGLGKTHLLHAIGNAVIERNPSAKVLYMSSETFTNELIQALRFAKMDEFKNRLRNIEVLLIDDIQFMCGKERTQEEFFHTFNALYGSKRQIVLTSDKVPQEMPGMEERLQTRFSWGLTADLQSPDFETRVAILNRKAAFDGFELSQDVAQYISEHVTSNVRELEGALTRLQALASLRGIPVSMALAESAVEPLIKSRKLSVNVDEIKKAVATAFQIKVHDMESKRRTKHLAFPRHVAMFLCRKHTTASFPEIGNQFGGRDHSSVIHATNVIRKRMQLDADLPKKIQEIEFSLFRK